MHGTRIDGARVDSVAEALAMVGWEGFLRLDRLEPEYRVLSEVYERTGDVRPVLVLGMAAATIDYQLAGDAYRFWDTLLQVVRARRYRLGSLGEVRAALEEFLSRPINARFNRAKRGRIARFFDSGFAQYLWSTAYRYYHSRPGEVWERLAEAMGNRPQSKTIVFSVKVMDLISLLAEKRYSSLPARMPIPVDIHVARMAVYSGIVRGTPPGSPADVCGVRGNVFREAWGRVAERVSAIAGRRISVLRIDSLVWQLGNRTMNVRDREMARRVIIGYLAGRAGIGLRAALRIADEFTHSWPTGHDTG